MKNCFAPIYLGYAIMEYYEPVPTCYLGINHLVTLFFGIETLLFFQECIRPDQIEGNMPRIFIILNQISVSSLVIIIAAFPLNYYKTPECMSAQYRIVMSFLFIPMAFIVLVAVLVIILLCLYTMGKNWYYNKRRKSLEPELIQLLSSSLTSPDRLKEFYDNNKSILKETPLFPCEMVFYKDNFEAEFGLLPNKFDSHECPICYDAFDNETKVITFPKCDHMFHHYCLESWLKKARSCALCKTEFRENFAEALRDKAERSFIKVSNAN